jgi:hypothetical protein
MDLEEYEPEKISAISEQVKGYGIKMTIGG